MQINLTMKYLKKQKQSRHQNSYIIFLEYFLRIEKTDSYCNLCLLVIIKTVNYVHYISNHAPISNVIWYIRTPRACQSKNVIYFLECISCNYATTLTSKSVDLHSRKNNHITSYRFGGSTKKFGNHIFYCVQNQEQELLFQILTFMKLVEEQNLLFYEQLQNRGNQ